MVHHDLSKTRSFRRQIATDNNEIDYVKVGNSTVTLIFALVLSGLAKIR